MNPRGSSIRGLARLTAVTAVTAAVLSSMIGAGCGGDIDVHGSGGGQSALPNDLITSAVVDGGIDTTAMSSSSGAITTSSSTSASTSASSSSGASSFFDPTCSTEGTDFTLHNPGYPVGEPGSCADSDGFTLGAAAAQCDGEVKYFGYGCVDFPARTGHPQAARAWTAYFACCADANCHNEQQDGEETDTDCGGSTCGPCGLGQGCSVDAECASRNCANGFCQPPTSCGDGVRDGDETDIDCGGAFCDPCNPGEGCTTAADCTSHVCSGGFCEDPSCNDGVMNGDETDADCGGSVCAPCPSNASCNVDSDCASDDCGAFGFCDAGPPPAPPPPACDCDSCKAIQMNGGTLPNPTKCTPPAKKDDPLPADCNGWTPAGELDNTNDISGAGLNQASHFTRDFTTACGEFRCTYLPRWQKPPPVKLGMLHGLLCFSKTSCNACAFDLDKNPDDPTTDRPFGDLWLQQTGQRLFRKRNDPPAKPPPYNTVNCADCHGPGPILPKAALWDDAQKSLRGLNQECSKAGGPKWLCFQGDAEWPAPNAADIVKSEDISAAMKKSCADGGCHPQGFIRDRKGGRYCRLMTAAFLPGGAMLSEGRKFPSRADCISWMKKMKCDPPDSTAFCSRADVAVQPP